MANRRGFSGGSRSRGTKSWTGTNWNDAAPTVTQVVIGTFTGLEEETLLRIRGNGVISGVPNADGDSDVYGIGLMKVTDQAAAVGGASVPGPIANPEADWIWHQYVPMIVGISGAGASPAPVVVSFEIDSKAMRKVNRDETLILVHEITSGQFASYLASGGMRALSLHG